MTATWSPLRLSIVVPTFNEAGNVPELLRRIEGVLGPGGWEVIFVDDDLPDGTSNVARSIANRDPRIRCLQRIGRRGLSSASIEGMLASPAPVIAVMDGDLQHDENILPRMLSEIENNGADVVVGTRYTGGGSVGDWNKSRFAMIRAATWVAQAALKQPVSDPMSGFFMLKRRVLDQIVHSLSGVGFKILLDMLASAKEPLVIVEVPYTFATV